MKLFYSLYPSPVGDIYIASTDRGMSDLAIGVDEDSFLGRLLSRHGMEGRRDDSPFRELFSLFDLYFCGKAVGFCVPLDLRGTGFELRVWDMLRRIPYGEVRSYRWVACGVGNRYGARAVGGACRKNPLPIIVPCHRVVRSSGGLGGYSAGVAIKRTLLEIEGVNLSGQRYCLP